MQYIKPAAKSISPSQRKPVFNGFCQIFHQWGPSLSYSEWPLLPSPFSTASPFSTSVWHSFNQKLNKNNLHSLSLTIPSIQGAPIMFEKVLFSPIYGRLSCQIPTAVVLARSPMKGIWLFFPLVTTSHKGWVVVTKWQSLKYQWK